MSVRRKWPFALAGVGVLVVACAGFCIGVPCLTTGFRYGLWADQCPVGDLRLAGRLDAGGLLRGNKGTITVSPMARYLQGSGSWAWVEQDALWRGTSATMELLDAEKQPVDGLTITKAERSGRSHRFSVEVDAALPDGDYFLRSTIDAGFESIVLETAAPFYAPALVHIATDRPLYKPGQEVQLRSIVLRRDDLRPLDGRPGEWSLIDPNGAEMHRERTAGGPWGITALSFPLDDYATQGTWTARYRSGADEWSRSFEVRPFQLPRLTVEATPSASFYGIGDAISVGGSATYASGAPVADGLVSLRVFQRDGRWPMPVAWEQPITTRTDASGRFEVKLGTVPTDLIELATLGLEARVSEAAGETAVGGASLVLAKDGLRVEAVTELGGGLVEGLNNRAYLRVMRPDGSALAGADVSVSNPWAPGDPAIVSKADADGVVAVNIDPGAPVTVVSERAPTRYRPLEPPIATVTAAVELLSSRGLSLPERRSLDTVLVALAPCQDLGNGTAEVDVALRVASDGRVIETVTGDSASERCTAGALGKLRFDARGDQLWRLHVRLPDSQKPTFRPSTKMAFGSTAGVDAALTEATARARRCVPHEAGRASSTPLRGHWKTEEGSAALTLMAVKRGVGHGLSAPQLTCLEQAVATARLASPAITSGMGTFELQMEVPRGRSHGGSAAATSTGFELAVAASSNGKPLGDTRLVLPVGDVPPLRIRVTPTLAKPGETLALQLLRGPDFRGTVPKKLSIYQGYRKLGTAEIDPDSKTGSFTLPADVVGFVHMETHGQRAAVFVERSARFDLALSSDKAAYSPGETAKLTVTTTLGELPAEGGVTLAGVDSLLGQLAPLAGPDDFGDVTVRAKAAQPAFGRFDPRALVLGQIRGDNAARAAVLRITDLPTQRLGDRPVSVSAQSEDQDDSTMVSAFYAVLTDCSARVRRWELEAKKGEHMKPATMAALWEASLDAVAKTDKAPVDAYGRRLTLDLLSDELLAQVDPRNLVSDSTRLPEDVEPWVPWVRREVNR